MTLHIVRRGADCYPLRIAQRSELGDPDLDVRGLEVFHQETGDPLGEVFDETEALFRQQRADALGHHAVIDGIAHSPGPENGVPREVDLEIDLDGLRSDLFVAVKTDPCRQAQLADENDIQGGASRAGLELNSCREF